MRKPIDTIVVLPYRLCEGAPFGLRAKFKLNLAGLLPEKQLREALRGAIKLGDARWAAVHRLIGSLDRVTCRCGAATGMARNMGMARP
jgi:hypothetical protein